MKAMIIAFVVVSMLVTSWAVAGPRITVVLSTGGGGCGTYMPPPCPPVYRPAPPIYGGCGYQPQPQLVRCSACFQVRQAGTICPCQQRNHCGGGFPGYNAGPPIGYNPGYNPGYDAQRRAIQQERQRLGYMDSYYRNLEQAQRDLWRAQNPYPGGGFGW